MAPYGYVSCVGCGRLFKNDGTEDDEFDNHDCGEEVPDPTDGMTDAEMARHNEAMENDQGYRDLIYYERH